MEKILSWLLRTTQNGSTYLQVIIVSLILCYLIYALIDTINKLKGEFDEEEDSQDDKNKDL